MFGMTNRKHHCRACGILCCDICSTKRLQLTAINYVESDLNTATGGGSNNIRNSISTSMAASKKEDFNRLCHEAVQPSPDHCRVKQLKQVHTVMCL